MSSMLGSFAPAGPRVREVGLHEAQVAGLLQVQGPDPGIGPDPVVVLSLGADHVPGPQQQAVRSAGVALVQQVGQDADHVMAELLVVAVGAGPQLVAGTDDLRVDEAGPVRVRQAARPAGCRSARWPASCGVPVRPACARSAGRSRPRPPAPWPTATGSCRRTGSTRPRSRAARWRALAPAPRAESSGTRPGGRLGVHRQRAPGRVASPGRGCRSARTDGRRCWPCHRSS